MELPVPVSKLTPDEFYRLRDKAILKFSSMSSKTVTQDIYKLRVEIAQAKADIAWACMYVINLYDPYSTTNYITENELMQIAEQLYKL